MEDINFVNMHRYQAIEKVVYQKVKKWKPKTIVELGHGSGALTVAMGLALKEINIEVLNIITILFAVKYKSIIIII